MSIKKEGKLQCDLRTANFIISRYSGASACCPFFTLLIAIFQFIVGGFAARRRKTRSVLAKTPTTESKIAIAFSVFISILRAENRRLQGVLAKQGDYENENCDVLHNSRKQ